MKKIFLLMVAAVCLFSACDKNDYMEPTSQESTSAYLSIKNTSEIVYCGTETIVDFLAGQHHLAGNIIVGNDADNLYVTFSTTEGWMLKATHLYAGACESIPLNKGKNPTIGKFPYKADHSTYVTSFTYSIPLDKLPECMCIATHAEVVKLDADNNIIQSETAWGKGDGMGGNSWAMKFDYCKQECVPDQEPAEYQTETAWVSGLRYTEQGNWATYYTYTGENNDVPVYAGQNINIGTASFSEIQNGYITISIELTNDWELQPETESVKVQGYDNAPSGNPAPGQFKTYKGTGLTIIVPVYDYYGIHLDVRKPI